jgi:hypothetical protein
VEERRRRRGDVDETRILSRIVDGVRVQLGLKMVMAVVMLVALLGLVGLMGLVGRVSLMALRKVVLTVLLRNMGVLEHPRVVQALIESREWHESNVDLQRLGVAVP